MNETAGHRISGSRWSCIACAITIATICALPATAHAGAIYVATANGFGPNNPASVSEFTLDGTPVSDPLITGLAAPFGIAATPTNVYVTNDDTGIVGKYNADGTAVNTSLIAVSGPTGIAVSGTNLYVASQGDGTVKLYDTSGTLINGSLITGLNGPSQIAVSGSLIFVANSGDNTIGEYTTAGVPVNTALISGAGGRAVAVSADGTDLFVDTPGATVSEYTILGTPVATLISGVSAQYLIVSGSSLYVDDFNGNIGQYTTSGVPINPTLISGLNQPLAFDVVAPEPTSLGLLSVGVLGLIGCRRRA